MSRRFALAVADKGGLRERECIADHFPSNLLPLFIFSRALPSPSLLPCSDWELHGPASPHSIDLEQAAHQTFKRRLGPTEVSYYLGSRGEGVESGVNDM